MNQIQYEQCMICEKVRFDICFQKYICVAHNNSFLNSKYHMKDYFTIHGICLDFIIAETKEML